MTEYESLKQYSKEDIKNLSFDELKTLVERMAEEEWTANTKQRILNILDVRDASPRIIEAKFEEDI